MKIPIFLAMTAAEFSFCRCLPSHIAWLACHFSPSGLGLSNIPSVLPPDSILILDDSIPFQQHDPEQILRQLKNALTRLSVQGLLLDFQRPMDPLVRELALLLQKELPCPVGAPPNYSDGHSPLFLPPIPLYKSPRDYLSSYKSREIWLETAWDSVQMYITPEGCRIESGLYTDSQDFPHQNRTLFCHYNILRNTDGFVFRLQRSREDLEQLSEEVLPMGVTNLVGLWQELKEE